MSFNIPNMAGSVIGVTGAWSRDAIIALGWLTACGARKARVNGNGQPMAVADAFYNGNRTWATPTAWSVTGYAQFAVNPQVTLGCRRLVR